MKLNLGSGPSGINGWDNFDWGMLPLLSKIPWLRRILIGMGLLPKWYETKWPKIKLVDIRKRLPLDDEKVDFIYCSHVLEHFEKWEVENILRETFRVLKKGGVVRVVLPDLNKLIGKYKNADEFCREFYGYEKDVKSWNQMFIRGHQWMYDKNSFSDLLTVVGFEKIKVCSIGKGKMPDIKQLDLKIHEELSMYLEAEKV